MQRWRPRMSLKTHYCIIRYVPDLVRNEGVNIGIALEVEDANKKTKYFHFAGSFQRVHPQHHARLFIQSMQLFLP